MFLLLLFFWLYTQKSIAGSYSCSIFGFAKHSYCCPQWLYQYTFLPAVFKGFFFQILCNICFLCSFDDSLSDRCEVKPRCFDSHFYNNCPCMCVCAKSLKSCLSLCNPIDCTWPRNFVHGILYTRILEWVAIFSSRGSSQPRD